LENKRKRKRINFADKSSDNVKKIQSAKEEIEIDIYFDKHYYLRNQIGDENGKRDLVYLY
jgi:hypothetical protein